MFAWDDIAVFLALYRERTTGRAASSLGCSQPTVVRRIAALEHELGLTLFDRLPTGLAPTDSARALLAPAEAVERSICAFSTDVDELTGSGLNVIRLTFLDHFERLLVPVLRDFRARWPGIQTQLLATDQMYDLARGEADIAIRGRKRPGGDEIVVHQLPSTGWTVYAPAESSPAERPHRPEEVGKFPLALLDGPPRGLPIYRWLESIAGNGASPIRCSNYGALKSAIASGAALSGLPCTVGDREPDLVRCFPPPREFDVLIYLVARRTMLRRPPARDLFDSIARYFEQNPSVLTGEPPSVS
ncbi:MAG TPA: LysR family transcriptional regulator [Allosphingosinicella sp.]|nr:LysR family transcriptional regulator [Allosphingosinicella sp.]